MSEGFPGGNGAPEYKGGLDEGDEVIDNPAETLRSRRLGGEALNTFSLSELDELNADYDKEIEELEERIKKIKTESARLENDIAVAKAVESAEAAKDRVNMDKAKRNRGVQGFIHSKAVLVIAGVMAALLLAGPIASILSKNSEPNNPKDLFVGPSFDPGTIAQTPNDTGQQKSEVPESDAPEDTEKAEELQAIPSNYSFWERIKSSTNAFREDLSSCYNNVAETKDKFTENIYAAPEYFSAYNGLFFDNELTELGISGMTPNMHRMPVMMRSSSVSSRAFSSIDSIRSARNSLVSR